MKLLMSIADKIQDFRSAEKITQEGVSRSGKIIYTTLGKIECGQVKNPIIKTLMRIARYSRNEN